MNGQRLTTAEVAEALAITPTHVLGLAKRRGWAIGNGRTWSRSDVEAERKARINEGTLSNVDGFTKAGAEKLADTIRAYWAARGQTVKVWAAPTYSYAPVLRTGSWYTVRSDLVDGRPRK